MYKALVSLIVLGLTVFLGGMIGAWTASAVSDCQSLAGNAQHCFAPAITGLFVGACVGLVIGIFVLIALVKPQAEHKASTTANVSIVEVHPAQPATVSDVVQVIVFCVLLVAFVMLAVWAST